LIHRTMHRDQNLHSHGQRIAIPMVPGKKTKHLQDS